MASEKIEQSLEKIIDYVEKGTEFAYREAPGLARETIREAVIFAVLGIAVGGCIAWLGSFPWQFGADHLAICNRGRHCLDHYAWHALGTVIFLTSATFFSINLTTLIRVCISPRLLVLGRLRAELKP